MDYKDLIDRLKKHHQSWAAYDDLEISHCLEDAADYIETMLAERDLAVELLRRGGKRCLACIYNYRSIHNFPCNNCKETGGMSDYWEWKYPAERR